jgi:hypothetical protein
VCRSKVSVNSCSSYYTAVLYLLLFRVRNTNFAALELDILSVRVCLFELAFTMSCNAHRSIERKLHGLHVKVSLHCLWNSVVLITLSRRES